MNKRGSFLIILLKLVLLWASNTAGGQDTNKPEYMVDSFDSVAPHGTPLSKTEFSESEKL